MAILHFYLGEGALAAVRAGLPRMPGHVKAAVEAAGWQVELHPAAERSLIPHRGGYHLVVNNPVETDRTLVLRVCGWEPFWRIESTNDRWNWEVAAERFDGTRVDGIRGKRFLSFWKKKVFGARPITRGGGIFVPLQGRLLDRRHFQALSPLQMLETVARRWPGAAINCTLHPAETYDFDELEALDDLQRRFSNLHLPDAESIDLLAGCDLVVTENSSMALKGYVAQKPALLFARIDFHHIAASVPRDGLQAAFERIESGRQPDFARYLAWYFRERALLAYDDNLQDQITARLRHFGWPL